MFYLTSPKKTSLNFNVEIAVSLSTWALTQSEMTKTRHQIAVSKILSHAKHKAPNLECWFVKLSDDLCFADLLVIVALTLIEICIEHYSWRGKLKNELEGKKSKREANYENILSSGVLHVDWHDIIMIWETFDSFQLAG